MARYTEAAVQVGIINIPRKSCLQGRIIHNHSTPDPCQCRYRILWGQFIHCNGSEKAAHTKECANRCRIFPIDQGSLWGQRNLYLEKGLFWLKGENLMKIKTVILMSLFCFVFAGQEVGFSCGRTCCRTQISHKLHRRFLH